MVNSELRPEDIKNISEKVIDLLSEKILNDKRLLTIFLMLKSPTNLRDLLEVHTYSIKKDENIKEEKIPKETVKKCLNLLTKFQLVEHYKDVDYNIVYYKLTYLGQRVFDRIKSKILSLLNDVKIDPKKLRIKSYGNCIVVEAETLEELIINKLQVSPFLIIHAFSPLEVHYKNFSYYIFSKE